MEELDKKLQTLHNTKDWQSAVDVVSSVCGLFGLEMAEDPFLFQHPKINAHTSWFMNATGFVNRPASYEVKHDNKNSLDIKLYWGTKISKTILSWMVGISPNFEDAKTFESEKYNIGLDIVIPKECDRIILLVSNKYKVRSFELKEKLSRTDKEIIEKLQSLRLKSTQSVEDKRLFHNILWDAFNFEPINRKFYKELVDRFTVLRDHLVKKDFDKQDAVIFSTRLIGRILFVWFLRKKKLINEKASYFDPSDVYNQTAYYKDRLEKLFFETLNTEILERGFDDVFTPYLNGGLFEASRTDFYKDAKLTIPDGYFSQFFEILSHYNFTVDESSPEFEQVAVDPEMLGRIFESLLAEQSTETGEQARKAKGAFYTPREIVQYMCEESLKEYLKTKIEDDTYRDIRIEEIVSMSEAVFRDQDHNKRRDWKPYVQSMTKALDELTVLDPAVGSGAYPMGMLHLLVKVYTRLDSKYEKNLSKLKRSILNRSLFGSDIDLTAIEICRLRAWLSLIVDLEENEQVAPLPNLEFHFVCANSLISLSKNSGLWDTPDLKEKMKQIRTDYYNTSSKTLKEALKKKYSKLSNPSQSSLLSENDNVLKTYQPFSHESRAVFFDPDLMFGVKTFDILIENPPYISYYSRFSQQDKHKDDVELLRKTYDFTNKKIPGRLNTLMFFIERSLKLTKNNGVASFIVDAGFHETAYKNIREYVLKNSRIIYFIDKISMFENVNSDQVILSIKNTNPDSLYKFKYFKDFKLAIENKYEPTAQNEIKLSKNMNFFPISKDNLLSNVVPLEELYDTVTGVQIGIGGTRKYKGENIENLFYSETKIDETYYPIIDLKGRNFFKYCNIQFNKFLKFDEKLGYEINKNVSKCNIALGKFNDYLCNDKIIVRQSSDSITASYTDTCNVVEYSAFCVKEKNKNYSLKYLLALLNSKFITNYSRKNHIIKMGFKKQPQIRIKGLNSIPIKTITPEKQIPFIQLVDQIIDLKKDNLSGNISFLEKQIDELVFDLYEITDEERELIRNSIK